MRTEIQIHTTDIAWIERRALRVEAGRAVVEVAGVEPVTFCGRAMVRADLGDDLPSDWCSRWAMVPAYRATPVARVCAGECGLLAEPGDVFCPGCREGHEHDRALGVESVGA